MKITSAAKVKPGSEMWQEENYSRRFVEPKKDKKFTISFESDVLAPFSEYRLQAKAASLKDEYDRPLVKPINMRFLTDHRPPDLLTFKNMPVLEKKLDTDLPVPGGQP